MKNGKSAIGLVLIDFTEVIVKIYQKTEKAGWKVEYSNSRDLATFKEPPLKATEAASYISEQSFSRSGLSVGEWRIVARNVTDEVAEEIGLITGVEVEKLTLIREQELLFEGLSREL